MKSFFLPLVVLFPVAALAAGPKKIDFNRDIRPILSDKCFHCHGPDPKHREAERRFDTREGLFTEKDGSTPFVPGKPEASDALKRIVSKDDDEVMPPKKANKTLKPGEIETLREWVRQGAEYKGHWSFVAPEKTTPPGTANPIDAFIGAKLAEKGLKPAPPASKEVLLRRATFALTGLPPTPEEVAAFVDESHASHESYEKLVDRLMASPHYGEQMARYWLDAVRYGDTHGLHLDNERSMWPYRDWVVKAFNENVPFDRFTRWQLAGDLLPNATPEQLIASGFNRCNVTTSEGGSITDELLVRYALDRTSTVAELYMGLTAGCAVCHDHKFDPLPQKEYYQLYAFFNSAADPGMDGNKLLTPPIYTITTPEQDAQLQEHEAKTASAEQAVKAALAKLEYHDPAKLDPLPEKQEIETVWLDDDLPAKAHPNVNAGNHPLWWVTAEDGEVFSGERALKRTDAGVAQDFFTGFTPPLTVPSSGKIFVHVFLDPADPPQEIMVQFHTNTWSHRVAWGDIDKIGFGTKGSTERLLAGPLPKAGAWVKLEVNLAKLKLPAGTQFSGFAFTQFGGTVYWDKLGVAYTDDPANDPAQSQLAWEKLNQGKNPKEFPDDIKAIFRSVKVDDRKPEQQQRLREYYLANIHAGSRATFDALNKAVEKAKKTKEDFATALPATLIMRDMEKPRPANILFRGQYDQTRGEVQPATPAFLPALAAPDGRRLTRLDLAEWLLSPQHPLTARVTVNRLWQQFFGTGIVKTAADFGSQGDPPTHPELLDWLAVTFRESGWNVNALVKLMLTSATYRQDSRATPALRENDPENRYYARGPRFRLDAEEVRDNALAVSGLLVRKLGGKGVKPYQPENIWEPVGFVGSNTREYKQDHGEALYRRSLYTFYKRTAPPPAMTTFDAPSREQSCTRRERSNTPLQALQLMNDVQHFEAARAFAERMMKEGGAQTAERLAWGFRLATARPPTADESEVLQHAYSQQLERYEANPTAALQAISAGESKRDEKLDPEDLAAFTLVANLILNLDEVLNRN